MFRLTFTRFIVNNRVALSPLTYSSHAQRCFSQKPVFQLNENAVLSTITTGNIN